MTDFSPDGQHSPERTWQAADRMGDLARFLNYATRSGAGGLKHPGDADALLAALSRTATRLPQMLAQTATWLQDECAAGRVSVTGGDHAGDPPGAVAEASRALMEAGYAAGRLQAALDHAHRVTATMSGAEGQ